MFAFRPRPALRLLLWLAFGLRIFALEHKAVWWDEAWSVWVAQHSLAEVTDLTARDVHPPLYQWALHGWVRAAGISEFSIRALSAFAGLLTVAGVYVLVRRLGGGQRAALLAALLIALSPFHIHWSQETRMYALAALWAVLAVYAYLRLGETWSGWWLLLILAGAAVPLTHYLGGFILVILNIHWLLLACRRSRAFHLRWLVAMGAVGVLGGAWMLYAAGRIRSGGATGEVAPDFIFQLAATLIVVGTSVHITQYTLLTIAAAAFFALGLALYARRNPSGGLLIALTVVLPPLAVYLLSLSWNPYYAPRPEERYFVIFAPIVFAGIGLAFDHLRAVRRIVGVGVSVALILLYAYHDLDGFNNRYFRDDYRSLMSALLALVRPGEPVFFIADDRYPLVHYNLDRAAGGAAPFEPVGIPAFVGDIDAQMQAVIRDAPRFWLIEIEAGLGDPQGALRAWIEARYARIYHTAAAYNGISLYTRADTALPASPVIVPPATREARPGDLVRIGVPAGVRAELVHDGQVIAAHSADTWQLIEFPIYPLYPPGAYLVRAGDDEYSLRIMHSQPAPGNPAHPLDVAIGPLRLTGYEFGAEHVQPGDSLEVTLYWRADQLPAQDYTVFFHLLGPFNPATGSIVWDGDDGYPANTPTTRWWVGAAAFDRRTVRVPEHMPPGTYTLEVGLYRLDTGERLLLADGSDHLVIPGVRVKAGRGWPF